MSAARPQDPALDATGRVVLDLAEALRALRDAGQQDLACRLAARAWSALRHTHPVAARRLEVLLHVLVRPVQPQSKEP